VAAETGGKYYQLSDLQSLLDDLTYRKTPFRTGDEGLVYMPINFSDHRLAQRRVVLRKQKDWRNTASDRSRS
jgi:hypothetical protein